MALWDSVAHFMALAPFHEEEPMELRQTTLSDLIQRANGTMRISPWRPASITEALGVPAIQRAVSLIANTVGALSMEAWRDGVKLPSDARPRLMVRPDPFHTTRDFYRDTAYAMATRGEAWWWVAARDFDNLPLSLLCVPPQEINVVENPKDLRYPVIEWRGRRMRNEDMRQITLNREPGELRGWGPLQKGGAAISVAVESQEWAANFYADGGYPSYALRSSVPLEGDEAQELKDAWTGGDDPKGNNTVRVIDPGIEDIKEFAPNPQAAAMYQARDFQNAEVGRMFGIGLSLLDVPVGGTSLSYQNTEMEFAKFVRACLWPNYLEPIEQTMSDLVVRSVAGRFNIDALTRADTKTRFESWKIGTEAGFLAVEEARQREGLEPGDVEVSPIPPAVPSAIPSSLPIERQEGEPVRCPTCGKSRFVVESIDPPRLRCIRCKSVAA